MSKFPDKIDFGDAPLRTPAQLGEFLRGQSRIDVLVVVDTEISFADADGFGVGRFIRLLRETTVGCTKFRVDVAVRSQENFIDNGTVPAGQARYFGFRFDSVVDKDLILDRYDEAFLFGFKPGNDDGPDSNIEQPFALPATGSELLQLTNWMNSGGGLFATGDHDYLGASMCYRIPRIGTMRKWTNKQGVPPIVTPARLDTNQPATAAQRAGTEVIPGSAETDAVPQKLDWVPERVLNFGFFQIRRPHEVLCHPQNGPIDVMPDHPHEGSCIEPSNINEAATVDFGAGPVAEYPEVNGHRELPKVIAYGKVVPDPPFIHDKGDVNPFTIPMISVYNGHKVGVGRVVTDSTWHHWFNLNLLGIEAAVNQTNWEKISRYYVNVATWIARPGTYRARCWWEIILSHFEYPGIEEFRGRDHIAIGGVLRDRLIFFHGPCTVTELVIRTICELDPSLCAFIEERTVPKFPPPPPCLTCPEFDVIERIVLAGFIEGTRPYADRLKAVIEAGEQKGFTLDAAEIEQAALEGARATLGELARQVATSAKETGAAFERASRSLG